MLKFCLLLLLFSITFLGDSYAAACSPSNATSCYTLQLHYSFEEGSDQTTVDLSGNNRTGTLVNNPTWVSDGPNSYLDFVRSNNTRVVSSSFQPPSDGVVAFWFKAPSTPSSRQRIFGFDDGWEIRWDPDDVMYLDINKTGTNSSIRTSSPISATNTWMHIAVVTSSTNNTWSVYIDGVLDNSGSETLTARPNHQPLTIGTRTGNNDYLNGSIDDFRIYSGVLTPQEIAELAAESPSCCLAYPYETDFEGTNIEWTPDNDWAISSFGHSGWQARSGSKFLDNNPSEIDQELHRNHYVTLNKSVYIPFSADQPTLSYYYKSGIFSGQFYSMISTDGINWATLETYLERDNHSEYTRRDVNLESYKGQNVQIRFRQYYNSGVGSRLFVIDDFRIGDFQAEDYAYPYTNGFESPAEREEFNYEGDWNSSTAHDIKWYPSEGSYFLDNNYNNEDQNAHYNQYVTMNGYITLPSAPENPMISFDYQAEIHDGYTYLQIQEYGSNTWTYLKVFSEQNNHKPYTRYEYHLANYLGKKVRFRFRQYWYAFHGARAFPIDNIFVGELKDTLPFPYANDFETADEQAQWHTEGDWSVSTAHDTQWFPSSGGAFLDNNADNEDQANSREHFATMSGYIPLPEDSSNVVVTFDYLLNMFDGQSYLYIQKLGQTNWTNLKTFNSQFNRSEYTEEEISLAAYGGEQVRFRFRQYYYATEGPRVFAIDDFKVENVTIDDYEYPYFNDFETALSTPLINGQDQWSNNGDWDISQAHDDIYTPESGMFFLDNNSKNREQGSQYYHYATMRGYVTLPSAPENPMVSFDYQSDIFNGYAYLQIQEYGSNTWTYLKVFSEKHNHKPYTRYEYHLANYVGKKVRFRFRQYWYGEIGTRVFSIDNFFVGELKDTLPFPYVNNFETVEEQAQWHTDGDWGVSTAHDQWVPSSGSSFLDNNVANEDQAYTRDHYATMSGYIPLPDDSSNIAVTFDYLLNVFDGQSYLYIQKLGQTNWTHLKTYNSQFNRSDYAQEEISLAAYGGEQVRFRFRQYYNVTEGPRVFAIDNFKVGDVTLENYGYPYFNDFETAITTPLASGQDQWANIGDWDISQAHDDIYSPESGSFFLDNNSKNREQGNQYYHYATMKGFVQLPDAPENPVVSFDYKLDIFNGYTYLQIQTDESNTWFNIRYFSTYDKHTSYTKSEAFLGAYAGKKVRFRFRQYYYNTPGRRLFSIDNFFIGKLTKTLPYPYTNTFETVEERDDWQKEGDWAVSTSHDDNWYPKSGSYFLDNNAENLDQAFHREHYATLSGYIQLPEDASNTILSFDYLLNTFDGQPYIYIQKFGDSTWKNLKAFTEVFNHSAYATEEISLAAYAGEKVRFRFRQYYYTEVGARVFAIDNFHVGEPTLPDLKYPYFNDFETAVSTPSINGQDHWNPQGDWGISAAHDDVYFPKSGNAFLDNNADNEDQGGHYNHYVDLAGYVPISADAISPQLSFWYRADIFNGWTFMQIQEKGSAIWKSIFTFSDSFSHDNYTKFYYDLSAYKDKSVRIRFRQYWYTSATEARTFSIDDFRIGEDDRASQPYPYTNTFETEEERTDFEYQGDWGASTAHDTDYVPFEGDWFMDNNVDFEDQYLHLQHFTTLSHYIPIPEDAELPTLTFKYKANSFDAGAYVEIKRKGEVNWTNLHSFTESFNHDSYVTYERNLDAYKGDEILIRFRQYWRYETGPRLFVVDNFRVGDFIQEDFIFPYYNNFDTAISTASKNGRDHWNTEGDWGISDQNTVTGIAASGEWFLNNNPADEDQSGHYNHYANMTGFVHIPSSAVNPKVSFDYVSNIFSGYGYLYMQKANNAAWLHLKTFTPTDNTETYKNYSRSLNTYKGDSVRFRFRQYNYSPSGARTFDIDNFTIDQELLGIWYFEENWEDATGQGFDLLPKNTPTFDKEIPRAKDGPIGSDTSTCFYAGYTDGQYAVASNTASQNVFNELTASVWIKPSSYKNNINSIITKGNGFSVYIDNVGRIHWQYLGAKLSTATAAPIDKWTHVAVTFKDGEQHIYINGASVASASVAGILTDLEEDIHIAADLNSSTNTPFTDRYFEGSIDELRVYRIAQSALAISKDMDVLHECETSVVPDHYQIEHDGSGLTCDAETVIIKACNDAECSSLNEEPTTVNFTVDGVLSSKITFTGKEKVSFSQLTPKKVLLSVSDPLIPALNATQCFNGSSNSCAIAFLDTGFKFIYGDDNSEDIPLQTAGVTIDALKIQAIKSEGGVCSALLSNKVVGINLSQENIAPTAIDTEIKFITNKVKLSKYFNETKPNFNKVNLAFNNEGIAEIPSIYYDAGEIKLHAQYTFINGVNVNASSKTFWVKPYLLQLLTTNTDPQIAGSPFDFTVTALAADKSITQNYVPQDIQMAVTRLDPVSIIDNKNGYIGGVDGSFTYANSSNMLSNPEEKFESVTLNTFLLGTSLTKRASYSEVGLLSVDVRDVGYGGVSDDMLSFIDADAIKVGRFKPDHFKVQVSSEGVFDNTCSAFTYTGQPLFYSLNFAPELTITAYNQAKEITRNYTEGEKYKYTLKNINVNVNAPEKVIESYDKTLTKTVQFGTTYKTTAGELIYNKSKKSEDKAGEESGGSMTYIFNQNDTLTYNKSVIAKVPEIQLTTYTMTVEDFKDSDGVNYVVKDSETSNQIKPTGVSLRYGRLALANNFGPETEDLPVTVSAEYWNGETFVVNKLDNCTTIGSNYLSMSSTEIKEEVKNVKLVEGVSNSLVLAAPNKQGEVKLEYDVSVAPWLKFDWDMKATTEDTDPAAKVMFGRFRGNDRVISWKEVF